MPFDLDLIERYAVEPESEVEQAAATVPITPATFSIYRTKLELICEEAKEILVRTGVSELVQSQDVIVGIFTAQGDLAVASVGTYLHAATGVIPVKYIRKHFRNDPSVGVQDGDNFFANEAIYGGIHNPDQMNIVPVFHDGEIIAWVAGAGHETEVGASEPGGYTMNARSRYEEGIKYPPIKIGASFAFRSDVLGAILNHVRDQHMIETDMRARTAACWRVRKRLLEIVAQKGPAFLVRILRQLTTYTARVARERVASLNDGIYRDGLFFDCRGWDEALGRVSVALVKRGDAITVDLGGTSPPTQSYLNTFPHVIRAHMASVLSQFIFSDLPVGSGMLEPFAVQAPPGTLVNPPLDTPVGGSIRISAAIANAVYRCIARMLYDSPYRDKCVLPLGAGTRNFLHGGINQHGRPITGQIIHSINSHGIGARCHSDGVDSGGMWFAGLADSMDCEHMEVQQPFIYLIRKLGLDQHGFGKYRGGSGVGISFVLHRNPEPYRLIHGPMTHRVPHETGLFGGYAAPSFPGVIIDSRHWQQRRPGEPLPATVAELLDHPWFRAGGKAGLHPPTSVPAGTIAAISSVPGCGYGDPLEREPTAVGEDLARGVLSRQAAESVYHVALDPVTGEVDVAATETARAAELADRRRRGRPYTEWVREWEQRRPPAEILAQYGPWPGAIRWPE